MINDRIEILRRDVGTGMRMGVMTGLLACVFGLAEKNTVADQPDLTPATESKPAFGVRKVSNLRYCDAARADQKFAGLCDVFLPQAADSSESETEIRRPVILVVHGGGWVTGSKWAMERHARELAAAGYAAVTINYRLAPTSKFPDPVDDVRSALVWISEQSETYGFDLCRVGLYGYSAGGHLVSLVATAADAPWDLAQRTTKWDQHDARWKSIPSISAVCVGGPPTDFRGLPPDNTSLSFFLGGSRRECPEIYEAASPIRFVSPVDPPFQIIHGESDWIVPVHNATKFHQALADSNVDAQLTTLPATGHMLAFISPELSSGMLRFFSLQFDKDSQ